MLSDVFWKLNKIMERIAREKDLKTWSSSEENPFREASKGKCSSMELQDKPNLYLSQSTMYGYIRRRGLLGFFAELHEMI